MLNPYQELVALLRQELAARGLEEGGVIVRFSMGEDLSRVRAHGTSRGGRSAMLWDRLDSCRPENLPRYPILHEDVLIGSLFADLDADSALSEGTLAHKLAIYADPIVTVYARSCFVELLRESRPEDPRNQGRHWLFTTEDKKKALVAIFAIDAAHKRYSLSELGTL